MGFGPNIHAALRVCDQMRMHQCSTACGYGNAFGRSGVGTASQEIVTFVLLVILLISVSLFLGDRKNRNSSLSSFRMGKPWKRRWRVRRRNYCSALHSGKDCHPTRGCSISLNRPGCIAWRPGSSVFPST